MATITVSGIDDELMTKLRARAAAHGRSLEAEVRAILVEAAREPAASDV
ncbi:FitA-like ribbon-helix-helix domain-containing protein [Luteimicrobium sp. DT211]